MIKQNVDVRILFRNVVIAQTLFRTYVLQTIKITYM